MKMTQMHHAKLFKAKVKENILTAAREGKHITFKEETIRQLTGLSTEKKKENEII